MNDVERLAAELRAANEELDVQSADLSEAVRSGRRRLFGRLIVVGLLSAVGATFLLTGGLNAPAAIKFHQQSNNDGGGKKTADHDGKGDGGGGSDDGGGSGGEGGTGGHRQSKGGGDGGKGGSGKGGKDDGGGKGKKKEEEDLPDLVVTEITPTEVFVENRSDVVTGAFSVKVVGENAEHKQVTNLVSFPEGVGAGEEAPGLLKTEILCSGNVFAEVDYLEKVEESDEGDNELTTCPEAYEDEDGKPAEEHKEAEEGLKTTEEEATPTAKSSSTADSGAAP